MILKCKMCGGDLNIEMGAVICECEFCGTMQTIPAVDNEKKGNLFNRANRLRMAFHQRVDEYGFVEDVARRNPYTRSSPNGQSFFLIMEAACRDFTISEKERQETK